MKALMNVIIICSYNCSDLMLVILLKLKEFKTTGVVLLKYAHTSRLPYLFTFEQRLFIDRCYS